MPSSPATRSTQAAFLSGADLTTTGYDQPGYGPAAVAELERCFKAGAEGVGELGDKGKGLFYGKPPAWGMHLDDPRMDSLLERCGQLGMPINIHVADPMWMYEPMDRYNDGLMNAYQWRLDNQTNILSHAELLGTLERAVRKHPRTLFVACHFANCSYDLAKLGALLDKYPNLYADISARYAETAAIPRAAKKVLPEIPGPARVWHGHGPGQTDVLNDVPHPGNRG